MNNEHLENNMLEDYLNNQSKQKYSELVSRIQSGEKLIAKVKPEYNHKTKRTFQRKLRLVNSREGMKICITTPVFKNYFLKESEIIEIL